MIFRHLVLVLCLGCVYGSQSQGQSSITNGRRPTIEETLRSHNVELTQRGLTEALRNVDPEVRSLAAQKLAQDDTKDAIPAIVEAVTAEKVPETRMILVSALASLGDEKGFSILQQVCQNSRKQPYIRLQAVRTILSLRKEDTACLPVVIEQLDRGDPDSRQAAAWLAPQFRGLTQEDSQKVLQGLLVALAAKESFVRSAASHALGEIKNSSAVPHLQTALANEQDENVRAQMMSDLQKVMDDEHKK